ncbi:O-antigen ligase family protein [Paenibacillus sp. GCM10012307]|uniref:O-antigen ligase family protein n=1 Tax=Paenibacillus roseus TaxID=2798579 RepID=A0A934J4M8_9BACL|nr:O-antigen ligase family protein [Paenibacillus roseus]MBJ6360262.1 O-antigen ligase family protein [Paenibacillus roseus]
MEGENTLILNHKEYSYLKIFFFLSLILLPVNGFPLGLYNELLLELGFYPYLILSPLIAVLLLKRFYYNSFVTKILLVFVYWNIVSGFANMDSILNSYYKQTFGLTRYLSQLLMVSIGYMIVLFISTLIVKYKITLQQISKYIIISIKICVLIGLIEILGKVIGINIFLELYRLIATAINRGKFIPDRIHSISGEPSWYGMFGAFAYPFLIYVIVKEKKHFMLLFLFLVTIYFTQSRTMYFIILLQTIFFLPILMKRTLLNKRNIGVAFVAAALVVGVVLTNEEVFAQTTSQLTSTLKSVNDFSLGSTESYSSMTRLGMQTTAFNMGKDNFFFGVGQGQFMFKFQEYVPEWALGAYEIQDALNPLKRKFPQAHGMFTRIFGELGAIGLIVWLMLWIMCIVKLFALRHSVGSQEKTEIYILLGLTFGVLACGMNVDSFRMMVVWITLGIIAGWYLLVQKTLQDHKEKEKIC